jgi:hypothetical protein
MTEGTSSVPYSLRNNTANFKWLVTVLEEVQHIFPFSALQEKSTPGLGGDR